MKKVICTLVLSAAGMLSVSAQQELDVQAHRGGMGLIPENTVASMINAVKMGSRTLELDCVISSDHQVVVSHDPYMSSVIMLKPDGSPITKEEEKNLALYQMSYEEIKKYDAGMKPHPNFPMQQKMKVRKPLLSEVIDSVETFIKVNRLQPVAYNIETKCSPQGDGKYNPSPEVFADLMMGVINRKGIAKRVTVQSFDIRTLQDIHKKFPAQSLSVLIYNKDGVEENLKRLGFTPEYFSPHYMLVTREMVEQLHQRKIKVLPWTVDEVKDMELMASYGVDGIISNYPDRLIKLYGNYQAK
ncbi:glycerophosphodiester phosphodiesterase family protein [Siphonobacter sp. SORGH_AS_1065]|uniref:glycerophosphodiester phosphodiesterase family protein n=1 Tax=Siphonobacter sp. SORGH_AS_1065 TaxID=3041795 RepID=UPI00277E5B3A|nr:glycerophosphodiester phosphodiesterase family protein [Siphonobacter sp. SORGH_AS_1065]MDQ1089995.1 glycerophosphoryl diester phosphodiesterase [Siphonobacter sp. SORGH_AS_1065]